MTIFIYQIENFKWYCMLNHYWMQEKWQVLVYMSLWIYTSWQNIGSKLTQLLFIIINAYQILICFLFKNRVNFKCKNFYNRISFQMNFLLMWNKVKIHLEGYFKQTQ